MIKEIKKGENIPFGLSYRRSDSTLILYIPLIRITSTAYVIEYDEVIKGKFAYVAQFRFKKYYYVCGYGIDFIFGKVFLERFKGEKP